MRKKIIFYKEKKNETCNCFNEAIKKEFDINTQPSKEDFLKAFNKEKIDAAVICLGLDQSIPSDKYNEEKIKELNKFGSFIGFIPVLSCTRKLDPNFIRQAVDKGISRFLSSELDTEKVKALLDDAINQNEIKKFIELKFPGCFERSRYAKKILNIVICNFPRKIESEEIAKELNISRKTLYQQSKKAFNTTSRKLTRILRIYYAARLMEKSELDNTEIAMQLNYSEESNMARDFRKVLQMTAGEARKKLVVITSNQLFNLIT
jgi:AraC-like DNA-binding protein